jgi:uncharacterized membrane protein YozB (DUF420 family)
VLTGPNVILALKVAVAAVTVVFLTSLVALARGHYRLHGRLNVAFFGLTVAALLALEVVVRLLDPRLFDYFDERTRFLLSVHLAFALPAAGLMGAMLVTGLTRRRDLHLFLAGAFSVLWAGTFLTGIFFLPHTVP